MLFRFLREIKALSRKPPKNKDEQNEEKYDKFSIYLWCSESDSSHVDGNGWQSWRDKRLLSNLKVSILVT